jgi:hypothetical protein
LSELLTVEREEKREWAAKALLKQGFSPLGTEKVQKDRPESTSPKVVMRSEMEARTETTSPININTTGPTNPLVARAQEILDQ